MNIDQRLNHDGKSRSAQLSITFRENIVFILFLLSIIL